MPRLSSLLQNSTVFRDFITKFFGKRWKERDWEKEIGTDREIKTWNKISMDMLQIISHFQVFSGSHTLCSIYEYWTLQFDSMNYKKCGQCMEYSRLKIPSLENLFTDYLCRYDDLNPFKSPHCKSTKIICTAGLAECILANL